MGWKRSRVIKISYYNELLLAIDLNFFFYLFTAPAPTSAVSHIATICIGKIGNFDTFYDPRHCDRLNNIKEAETDPRGITPDQIVFAIRFPFPGQSMSRWFQFVATSIRLDIEYRPEFKYDDRQGTLKGHLCVRLF